jgi:hypothetical protein
MRDGALLGRDDLPGYGASIEGCVVGVGTSEDGSKDGAEDIVSCEGTALGSGVSGLVGTDVGSVVDGANVGSTDLATV